MKFFNYYIGIFLLCTLAGVAAKFLVPSPQSVALMYMNAKMYDDARRRYELMLAAGDDSGNVVIPLARLYEMQGEIKKAVGLLVKYIQKKPDLADASLVLKQIYDRSLSQAEYLKILDRIPEFSSPEEVLSALSYWYETVQQDERQVEILFALAQQPETHLREFDFQRLIAYYSVNMKMAPASALIRQLLAKVNYRNKEEAMLFSLTTLLARERYRDAMVLANKYLIAKRNPTPFEVEKIVDLFIGAGQIRVAREICNRFLSNKEGRATLALCELRMKMAEGHAAEVLKSVDKDFHAALIRSQRTYNYGIAMALENGDLHLAKDILAKSDFDKFSDKQIFDYVFYSLKNGDPELAALVKRKLDPERLRFVPCLSYAIGAAIKGKSVTEMTEQALMDRDLGEVDRIELGYLLYRFDCHASAYALIKNSPIMALFPFFKPRELSVLVIAEGDPSEYMARCESEALREDVIRRRMFRDLRFCLAAATGMVGALDKLIVEYDNIAIPVLVDAYSLAMTYRKYGTAVATAQALVGKYKGESSQYFLAAALSEAGSTDRALALLLPLKKKMRPAESLFLRVAGRNFEQGGLAITQTGMRAEVDATLAQVMGRENATPSELKSAAICLAGMGEKEKAEKLYLGICRRGEMSVADIDELVKLCGHNPGSEIQDWFAAQARTGKWERWRRLAWLNSLGMYKETVAVVDGAYRGAGIAYLAEYLTALSALERHKSVELVLSRFPLPRLKKADARERIALIKFLVKDDRATRARPLLLSLTGRNLLAHLAPTDVASLFVDTDTEKEGINLFAKTGGQDALQTTLYLHACVGDDKFVSDWLNAEESPKESTLNGLYYFAVQSQRTALALTVAKRTYKLYPTLPNRCRLAESLIGEKHYSEGLALIEKDVEDSHQAASIYLAGISGLATEGKFSRDSQEAQRFIRICDKLLKAPKVSRETFISVAYALMSTGYYDRAKPLFFKLASNSKDLSDSFLRLYLFSSVMAPSRQDFRNISTLIAKTKKDDETEVLSMLTAYDMQGHIMMLIRNRYGNDVPLALYPKYLKSLLKCRQMRVFDQVVKRMPPPQAFNEDDRCDIFATLILANKDEKAAVFFEALKGVSREKIPPSLVRRLGLYFSNRKDYAKAIELFWSLAQESKDPDSADVSLLVSIPGVADNRQIVDWLVRQARTSHGEAQLKWLEYLNFIKKPREVIAIIGKYYAQ